MHVIFAFLWFELFVIIVIVIFHLWCLKVGAYLNLISVQHAKLYFHVRGCFTNVSLLLLIHNHLFSSFCSLSLDTTLERSEKF